MPNGVNFRSGGFFYTEKILRFDSYFKNLRMDYMKAFLLTAAIVVACAGGTFAQNLPPDYYWEVGVNGGLCGMTRPEGPANAYQGTRTSIMGDLSVRVNYYFNPNWMIFADFGDRRWEKCRQLDAQRPIRPNTENALYHLPGSISCCYRIGRPELCDSILYALQRFQQG